MTTQRNDDTAVNRYAVAAAERRIDELMQTLSPDVEVRSPISGRLVFAGHREVRYLLTAVYGALSDLRWHGEFGEDDTRVLVGEGSIGRLRLTDAMVFELTEDGLIRRVTPHLRPWISLSALALRLLPRLIKRPRLLLAAWRRGNTLRCP